MSYQMEQDGMPASNYYPDNYQVEVTNMQGIGFNQGLSFGCGFSIAALMVWLFVGFPLTWLIIYLIISWSLGLDGS